MGSKEDLTSDLPGAAAHWWRDLRLAAAFLTRLPVSIDARDDEARDDEARDDEDRDGDDFDRLAFDQLGAASRTFPLVGAAVGGFGAAGLMLAAALGLPPLAWALVALGLMVLVTGGLHEDGLADTADGLGGGASAEDSLRIMRDSRTGAYGVLALVFSVGLRAALLAGMDAGTAAFALIGAAAFSRAVLPLVMNVLNPARDDGLGAGAGRPDDTTAMTALGLGAVLVFLFTGLGAGILALPMAAAAAAGMALFARARVGGFTGDVLGAVQQVTETAVLVAVAVLV